VEEIDVAIIGGGVVGVALARELSASRDDVFLFERMPKVGMMTSTRNSGVLHSGIYYEPGSLKARFCLPGNRLTKEFCANYGVPIKNCGKLIVALDEREIPQLEKLAERGRANGVEGTRVIGHDRIRELEPNITVSAALEVPSAAVVNAEELVKTYARLASGQGANILTEARVLSLEPRPNSIVVTIERGTGSGGQNGEAMRESFAARCVINSAGLYADEVAALVESSKTYRIYPVRGEYARLQRSKAHLVNALVYPLPHSDILVRDVTSRTVHLTRTVEGDLLVGPTARYVSGKDDYENDLLPLEDFVRGIRPFLPAIELADLRLAHSGLRPQLIPPGGHGTHDYVIERSPSCPRLINLIGMESPALTSAPAIAQYTASVVRETLS
jgi:glycerol-3-phosphate dehydrogenase